MTRPTRSRTLSREAVIEAAASLLDERGRDGLTLAELAKRLGVRSPSLYNHVDGLDGLLHELRLRALNDLRRALERATIGRSQRDALAALCLAYRAYVHEHPGLYGLTVRSSAAPDAQEQQAGQAVVEVALAVLHGYGLHGDHAIHATRFLRSALHGFAVLELEGGFGLDLSVNATFDLTMEALHRALLTLSDTAAHVGA